MTEAAKDTQRAMVAAKAICDGREVEFAGCLLRILDTAAALGFDLAGAVIEKNRYNQQRTDHKLVSRAAGGKRY